MKKLRTILGITVILMSIGMFIGGLSVVDKLPNTWDWKTITIGLMVGLSPLVTSSGICLVLWEKL